jgi:hypothetical protein
VFVLWGTVPTYRSLGSSSSEDDVRQLQSAMRPLGALSWWCPWRRCVPGRRAKPADSVIRVSALNWVFDFDPPVYSLRG